MRLYDNIPKLTREGELSDKENIVFDLYGTLIDIHTDEENKNFWKKFAKYLRKHGMKYDYKCARAVYLLLCDKYTKKLQSENPDKKIEIEIRDVFYDMCRIARPNVTRKESDKVAEEFRKMSTVYIRLYDDVFDMLETLKKAGKKVWLLSNAQSVFTLPEMKRLGILPYFDGIAISSDAGVKKPDKAFAGYLFEKYSLNPTECLMVGNEFASDVEVAKASGMEWIYVVSNLTPYNERIKYENHIL